MDVRINLSNSGLKNQLKKTIAAALAVIFIVETIPAAPFTLTLNPAPASSASLKPMVTLLQDVHSHLEAQQNMIEALKLLKKKTGASTFHLGLEGAAGPLDFEPYRKFPDPSLTRRLAEEFLVENRINGPVLWGLLEPGSTLSGIESPELYRQNVEAYRQAHEREPIVQKQLETEAAQIEQEKKKIFSGELLSFDRQISLYKQGRLSLSAYLKELSRRATTPSFTIESFLSAQQLEATLDFDRVNREKEWYVHSLTDKLSPTELRHLSQWQSSLNQQDDQPLEALEYLLSIGKSKGLDLSRAPQFQKYVQYLQLVRAVDPNQLFSEALQLEKECFERLAGKSNDAKNLIARSRRHELTQKLAKFELTPEEWKEYTGSNRISDLSEGEDQKSDLTPFRDFYLLAEKRNEVFVRHIVKNKLQAVVVGGFHTPGLIRLLERRGVDVRVVRPRFQSVPSESSSSYLSVFAQKKTPLEKLFSRWHLFLALPVEMGVQGPPLADTGQGDFRAEWAARYTKMAPAALKTLTAIAIGVLLSSARMKLMASPDIGEDFTHWLEAWPEPFQFLADIIIQLWQFITHHAIEGAFSAALIPWGIPESFEEDLAEQTKNEFLPVVRRWAENPDTEFDGTKSLSEMIINHYPLFSESTQPQILSVAEGIVRAFAEAGLTAEQINKRAEMDIAMAVLYGRQSLDEDDENQIAINFIFVSAIYGLCQEHALWKNSREKIEKSIDFGVRVAVTEIVTKGLKKWAALEDIRSPDLDPLSDIFQYVYLVAKVVKGEFRDAVTIGMAEAYLSQILDPDGVLTHARAEAMRARIQLDFGVIIMGAGLFTQGSQEMVNQIYRQVLPYLEEKRSPVADTIVAETHLVFTQKLKKAVEDFVAELIEWNQPGNNELTIPPKLLDIFNALRMEPAGFKEYQAEFQKSLRVIPLTPDQRRIVARDIMKFAVIDWGNSDKTADHQIEFMNTAMKGIILSSLNKDEAEFQAVTGGFAEGWSLGITLASSRTTQFRPYYELAQKYELDTEEVTQALAWGFMQADFEGVQFHERMRHAVLEAAENLQDMRRAASVFDEVQEIADEGMGRVIEAERSKKWGLIEIYEDRLQQWKQMAAAAEEAASDSPERDELNEKLLNFEMEMKNSVAVLREFYGADLWNELFDVLMRGDFDNQELKYRISFGIRSEMALVSEHIRSRPGFVLRRDDGSVALHFVDAALSLAEKYSIEDPERTKQILIGCQYGLQDGIKDLGDESVVVYSPAVVRVAKAANEFNQPQLALELSSSLRQAITIDLQSTSWLIHLLEIYGVAFLKMGNFEMALKRGYADLTAVTWRSLQSSPHPVSNWKIFFEFANTLLNLHVLTHSFSTGKEYSSFIVNYLDENPWLLPHLSEDTLASLRLLDEFFTAATQKDPLKSKIVCDKILARIETFTEETTDEERMTWHSAAETASATSVLTGDPVDLERALALTPKDYDEDIREKAIWADALGIHTLFMEGLVAKGNAAEAEAYWQEIQAIFKDIPFFDSIRTWLESGEDKEKGIIGRPDALLHLQISIGYFLMGRTAEAIKITERLCAEMERFEGDKFFKLMQACRLQLVVYYSQLSDAEAQARAQAHLKAVFPSVTMDRMRAREIWSSLCLYGIDAGRIFSMADSLLRDKKIEEENRLQLLIFINSLRLPGWKEFLSGKKWPGDEIRSYVRGLLAESSQPREWPGISAFKRDFSLHLAEVEKSYAASFEKYTRKDESQANRWYRDYQIVVQGKILFKAVLYASLGMAKESLALLALRGGHIKRGFVDYFNARPQKIVGNRYMGGEKIVDITTFFKPGSELVELANRSGNAYLGALETLAFIDANRSERGTMADRFNHPLAKHALAIQAQCTLASPTEYLAFANRLLDFLAISKNSVSKRKIDLGRAALLMGTGRIEEAEKLFYDVADRELPQDASPVEIKWRNEGAFRAIFLAVSRIDLSVEQRWEEAKSRLDRFSAGEGFNIEADQMRLMYEFWQDPDDQDKAREIFTRGISNLERVLSIEELGYRATDNLFIFFLVEVGFAAGLDLSATDNPWLPWEKLEEWRGGGIEYAIQAARSYYEGLKTGEFTYEAPEDADPWIKSMVSMCRMIVESKAGKFDQALEAALLMMKNFHPHLHLNYRAGFWANVLMRSSLRRNAVLALLKNKLQPFSPQAWAGNKEGLHLMVLLGAYMGDPDIYSLYKGLAANGAFPLKNELTDPRKGILLRMQAGMADQAAAVRVKTEQDQRRAREPEEERLKQRYLELEKEAIAALNGFEFEKCLALIDQIPEAERGNQAREATVTARYILDKVWGLYLKGKPEATQKALELLNGNGHKNGNGNSNGPDSASQVKARLKVHIQNVVEIERLVGERRIKKARVLEMGEHITDEADPRLAALRQELVRIEASAQTRLDKAVVAVRRNPTIAEMVRLVREINNVLEVYGDFEPLFNFCKDEAAKLIKDGKFRLAQELLAPIYQAGFVRESSNFNAIEDLRIQARAREVLQGMEKELEMLSAIKQAEEKRQERLKPKKSDASEMPVVVYQFDGYKYDSENRRFTIPRVELNEAALDLAFEQKDWTDERGFEPGLSYIIKFERGDRPPVRIPLKFKARDKSEALVFEMEERYQEKYERLRKTIHGSHGTIRYLENRTMEVQFLALESIMRTLEDSLETNRPTTENSVLDSLLGIERLDTIVRRVSPEEIKGHRYHNKDLLNDEFQREAVESILSRYYPVVLVRGSPGTGKTTIIEEACHHLVDQGAIVVAVTQSNYALDLIGERLKATWGTGNVIRFIRAAASSLRVSDELKEDWKNRLPKLMEYLEGHNKAVNPKGFVYMATASGLPNDPIYTLLKMYLDGDPMNDIRREYEALYPRFNNGKKIIVPKDALGDASRKPIRPQLMIEEGSLLSFGDEIGVINELRPSAYFSIGDYEQLPARGVREEDVDLVRKELGEVIQVVDGSRKSVDQVFSAGAVRNSKKSMFERSAVYAKDWSNIYFSELRIIYRGPWFFTWLANAIRKSKPDDMLISWEERQRPSIKHWTPLESTSLPIITVRDGVEEPHGGIEETDLLVGGIDEKKSWINLKEAGRTLEVATLYMNQRNESNGYLYDPRDIYIAAPYRGQNTIITDLMKAVAILNDALRGQSVTADEIGKAERIFSRQLKGRTSSADLENLKRLFRQLRTKAYSGQQPGQVAKLVMSIYRHRAVKKYYDFEFQFQSDRPDFRIISRAHMPKVSDQFEIDMLKRERRNILETRTIDSMQGHENKVIIISLTRSYPNDGIGFLGTEEGLNRLYVAFTRFQQRMAVIGNWTVLGGHENFKRFLSGMEEIHQQEGRKFTLHENMRDLWKGRFAPSLALLLLAPAGWEEILSNTRIFLVIIASIAIVTYYRKAILKGLGALAKPIHLNTLDGNAVLNESSALPSPQRPGIFQADWKRRKRAVNSSI